MKHTYYAVLTTYYPNGLVVSSIAGTEIAKKCPKCGFKFVGNKEIYINWYTTKENAQKAVLKEREQGV